MRLDISTHFTSQVDEVIYNYLTENDFTPDFTLQNRVYYSFIRPLLPRKFRFILQKLYKQQVDHLPNFIKDDYIEYLQQTLNRENIFQNIYHSNYSSACVLTHDVEEQEGFNFIPKVIELLRKYDLKASWNIVPYKYKIDEGIINLIKNEGHEIGIHGYNHDGKLYYSEKIFNDRVPLINHALKKYDAIGFRSPQVHRNLRYLQKLDITYDASTFDYDPYQPFPGGTGSIWPFLTGKFVELPYTIPQDHTMFYILKSKDINIWKNKINWIVKNNGVVLTLAHPDYLTEMNNFKKYEELLMFIKDLKNTWFCLPKELSEWWKLNFSLNKTK